MSSRLHDDAFKESSKLRAKSASENLNTVEGQGSNHPSELRSILKKSDQLNSNKRNLSVRFTLPLTIREENKLKLGLKINAAMDELLMTWAMHYAHVMNRPSNYIDRVVFNFQPGMTANYLAYLLSVTKDPNISDFSKDGLATNLHKDFDHFLETFSERKKRTYIVDQFNVESEEIKSAFAEDSEPSIFIIQCSDPVQNNQIKSLIESCKRTRHSLIVFTEPIHGLHKYKLEVALNIKVRHLVLPRLIAKPKDHIGTKYDYYDSEYEIYHGIPLILENAKDYLHFYRMLEDDMSLWLRPNYAPFIGYFFTLFDMEAAEIPFTRKTKLPSSKMTVFDVAAILGFNIEVQEQYNRVPISTGLNQPLILKAIKPLKSAFESTCHKFDTFSILHGEYLKQLYLEKAIARAMTNKRECRGKLGERWTFLSNSFFKNERADLTLMPQVIPSVMRCSNNLDDYELYKWSRGNRSSAPQPTMLPSDWPLLFEDLIIRRTIVPADNRSQSPDCMFAFEDGLLCFYAKSNSKDLTMDELIEEIGKAPFLTLDAQKSVVRLSSEYEHVKISLVYLAQSHSNIKSALLAGFAKSEKGTVNGITKDHRYIHVAYGNKVLPLPDQNIEVIVLLRAGIQSLIGWDGYTTLVHPFAEINALRMLENYAR